MVPVLFQEDSGSYGIDRYVLDDDKEFTQTLYSCVKGVFLTMRSAPAYDDANIITEIYDNDTALYMTGYYSENAVTAMCPLSAHTDGLMYNSRSNTQFHKIAMKKAVAAEMRPPFFDA